MQHFGYSGYSIIQQQTRGVFIVFLCISIATKGRVMNIRWYHHCYSWDAKSKVNDSGMRFQEAPPPPPPPPSSSHSRKRSWPDSHMSEPGDVQLCFRDRCMLLSCGDVDDVDPSYWTRGFPAILHASLAPRCESRRRCVTVSCSTVTSAPPLPLRTVVVRTHLDSFPSCVAGLSREDIRSAIVRYILSFKDSGNPLSLNLALDDGF